LRPEGLLVFQSRDPAKKAELEQNRDPACHRAVIPDAGPAETCTDLTEAEGNLASVPMTKMNSVGESGACGTSSRRFTRSDGRVLCRGLRLAAARFSWAAGMPRVRGGGGSTGG
jgi:hypothetical protein